MGTVRTRPPVISVTSHTNISRKDYFVVLWHFALSPEVESRNRWSELVMKRTYLFPTVF
jgi:hypothetical protein